MVARIDPTLALHEAIRGLEGDRDAGLHARGNQDRHQRPGLERGALVARVDTDTESPTATGSKSTHAGVTASGGNLRAASGLRDKQQDGWRIGVPTLGQPTASVRVSAVDEVGRKLPIWIPTTALQEAPDALFTPALAIGEAVLRIDEAVDALHHDVRDRSEGLGVELARLT